MKPAVRSRSDWSSWTRAVTSPPSSASRLPVERLGVADRGADAEAGQDQERDRRDDQDGDQLGTDASCAVEQTSWVTVVRGRRFHPGFTTSHAGAGWRRIILSLSFRIRHRLRGSLYACFDAYLVSRAGDSDRGMHWIGAGLGDDLGRRGAHRRPRPLTGPDKAIGTDSVRGAQLAARFLSGEEGQLSLAGIGADGLARLGRPKVTVIPATPAARPPRRRRGRPPGRHREGGRAGRRLPHRGHRGSRLALGVERCRS